MSYQIIFSDNSWKQLRKLPKEAQRRILATLKRCKIRPYPYVKKLIGLKYYKLRVGKYRIILDIKDNELIIFVVKLAHRKKVYK